MPFFNAWDDVDSLTGPLLNTFENTGLDDLVDAGDVSIEDIERDPNMDSTSPGNTDSYEPFQEEGTGVPNNPEDEPGANQIISASDFDEVIETHGDAGYPDTEVPNADDALQFSEEDESDDLYDQDDPSTVDERDEVDQTEEVSEYEEVDERDEVDQAEEVSESEEDGFPETDGQGFAFHEDPEEAEARLQEELFEVEDPEQATAEAILSALEEEGFDTQTIEEALFPEEDEDLEDESPEFGTDDSLPDAVSNFYDSFSFSDILGDEEGSEASGEPVGSDDGLDIVDSLDDIDGSGALDVPEEVEDWFGLSFDFGVDDDDYAGDVISDTLGENFGDAAFEITEESLFGWQEDELDNLGWELDFV